MPIGTNRKKKHTYLWVSAVILIFGFFAVYEITKRIKTGTVTEHDRMSSAITINSLDYLMREGQKRKVPPFAFINQDSLPISNEDYKGKVYVAAFFFTTCPTICPIMTQNLVALQDTFKNDDNFGVAAFTINPKYDTPSVLKAYAKRHGITDTDYHLLTGDPATVYKLAQEGFYLVAHEQKNAPGGFEHSGMFALIDKKGYLRSRKDAYGNPLVYYRGTITEKQRINTEGQAQQITFLKEDIKKLLAE